MYENLRKIRQELNISVEELCDLLGLETKAAYYKKETGLIKFSLQEAKLISDRLKLPIEHIFFANELSEMEHK